LFDRLAAEPLAQALASRRSTALLCERPPSNTVEPRKRILRKRRASAPRHRENLRRDLLGGLRIGSTKRIAMHRAGVALVETGHRLQLITAHTPTMAGRTLRITCCVEIMPSAHRLARLPGSDSPPSPTAANLLGTFSG